MDLDDSELVDAWLATWLHVRGITAGTIDGWPLVRVGSASREVELVCLDPGVDAFTALMEHVRDDPRAMLTVAARDVGPYLVARRPDGVRVDRDDETLMSTIFTEQPVPPLDDELTFRWDVEDHRITYVVEAGDRVAGWGTTSWRRSRSRPWAGARRPACWRPAPPVVGSTRRSGGTPGSRCCP
jgi:hypothetical protein